MLVDAHCHPYDLAGVFPEAEYERRQMGVLAAASACGAEEFAYNETLAHNAEADNAASLLPCFAVHPQQFAVYKEQFNEQKAINDGQSAISGEWLPADDKQLGAINNQLDTLNALAAEGRIAAIGECGFDLYNTAFKETEALQDRVFAAHLEIALRYDLPVILHVRRAMHKIFDVTKILAGCKAVIFHSWSGTLEEGRALLRRGVNAYFSFGNVILLNHKQAIRSCALLPMQRLLTETDAPYQPPRGQKFSQWSNLPKILKTAAVIRNESGLKSSVNELETQIEDNFKAIFK